MSHFKNIHSVLLSFLVVVSVYTSCDFTINQESSRNDYTIELLQTQNQYKDDSIDFEQVEQSFTLLNSIQSYKENYSFNYLIENQNSLERRRFNTQQGIILSFKSALLQIVLNDVSILKSHCI